VYSYDEEFYTSISSGSTAAARVLAPLLRELSPLPLNSVLDVGCGIGAWLLVWKEAGLQISGLDGDYVDRQQLLIEPAEFRAVDLSSAFDLDCRFDLVQSLEVAEHLPPSASDAFVGSLCKHGDMVLFSAAAPGQGGENHINERPFSYWRDRFAAQGFRMYDPLRSRLAAHTQVMPWYRYNSFVYVREDSLPEVHSAWAHCAIAADATPPDISPPAYRVRKQLISLLPVRAVTALAVAKKHLANSLDRGRRG
jgi:SAM-dependent methyltransferase